MIVCINKTWFAVFLLIPVLAHAQVSNNQIEHRVTLHPDSGWYSSTTMHANVEWDCINRNLTARCLVYHNDQWFSVKPDRSGPLFINVARQRCKNLYGVQLVVLEGDPCKTDSYILKKCIPFTDQSDFFVRLDSLNTSQEYLINIDGYLGDQCSFDISFSSTSKGIPVTASSHKVPVAVAQNDSIISLQWSLSDTLSFEVGKFQVYRKKEGDAKALQLNVPVVRNAYGLAQRDYKAVDTLHQHGKYTYKIYGRTANDHLLLAISEVTFLPGRNRQSQPRAVQYYKREFEYYVRKDCMVSIHVLDAGTEKRLFTTNRRAMKGKNTLMLDFRSQVRNGIFLFDVVVEGKDVYEVYTIKFSPSAEK